MKILLGYKGNNFDKDLIDIAVKHAKAFDGELFVVTSLIGGDKTEQKKIIAANKKLDQAKDYCNDLNIKCDTHLLVRGLEAGEDIVRFAKEQKIDEIIIKVRNRSKVGKLIFGSVAQVVILESDCPVLTAK